MADCPYARCIQERRHIRRELLRWTKNMVFVVGLERVAEELMGRRRWKQYQDTLYSGSRSSESATGQPHHHRLYPAALSSGCNPVAVGGNLAQVGPHLLQTGTTTTTVAPVASPTTTGPLKQEALQRHQPPNHHHLPQELQHQRLRPEGIKLETEEDELAGGPTREDASTGPRTTVVATTPTTPTTIGALTTTATTTTSVATRRRPRRALTDGEDPERLDCEGETGEDEEREPEEAEKRLKLDEETANRSVSPLRGENERSTRDHPTTNATDTEGTKERTEEVALERIPVTQGLLRVKKEEELQEPSSGGGLVPSPATTKGPENAEGVRPEATSGKHSFLLGHRHTSPPPEDWKPLDKCYFCLDGKLPHDDQPPLSPQSDSSSSSRSAESPMSAVQVDPMAASVVAAALGVGETYPTLLHQWVLPPREPPLPGVQVHQDNAAAADQPLDLSAKPKNSQDNNISLLEQQKIPLRMPAGIAPKTFFNFSYRAKPRTSVAVPAATAAAVAAAAAAAAGVGVAGVPAVVGAGGGRRTYTEEELQAALRDIQSGKLGTRRAAVIYGIPRSTLRNKVYKLAMERERDASLTSTHSHPHEPGAPATTTIITTTTTTTTTTPSNTTQNASATTPPPQVDEVDDKELSGAEEEKEVEKALRKPLLSLEDLVRFSALEGSGGDSLRTLLQRGQEAGAEWAGLDSANIGPYIQKMLAAAVPFKGLEIHDYRIPDVMTRLMSEDKRLSKSVNGDQAQQHHQPHHHHHQQHHHQTQGQQQPSQPQQQQPASRGPMTNDDFNPAIEEEASDSAQGRAILKIPSYKPTSAASTPGCSGKNGEPTSAAFAQGFAAAGAGAAPSPGLLERASPAFSGTSSPTNSLVGKAAAVNFRDVIAKSISVKFQESQPQTGALSAAGLPGCPTAGGAVASQQSMISEPNPFKRGRYTPPQPPATTQQGQPAAKPQSQDQNKPKPGTGGKGTRPKRGKYRNYDRDSLVEAVRAVQRGEMSVHRAGSYYGVPHSTLEYKVKERHLMRPRKRDQKQPDDKAKESGATAASVGGLRPGSTDKTKPATLKPQKPFATAPPGGMPGPNGLKMPPFIEGMPHLPFAPFSFWNSPPFMPSPFMASAPSVPTMLPEQYFATQRMRGLQEQQRNAAAMVQQHQQRDRDGNGIAVVSGAGESASTSSNSRGGTSMAPKTPRDMAESLYDGTGANGSFLDNLIRSSLETGIPRDQQRAMAEARGQPTSGTSGQQQTQQQQAQQQHPETMSSKALIDQLCRNSRRTPLPRIAQDSSEDESYRGPGASRVVPERPERVPTVDLSPSPSDRARTDDGSDRLTSPPTPLSVSRAGSRDEDSTRDSRIDRSSREREVHNGGQEDRERKTLAAQQQQQLNNYPDLHNLYAVSTDKKSACDSKLIVDHSSQKTQPQPQQQQQQQTKEYAAVGGLVVQLQRGYNAGSTTGRPEQPQANSQQPSTEQRNALAMEDSVEQ